MLETPRQKWLICMVSFDGRLGQVGRAAGNQGEGKHPPRLEVPTQRVLEQYLGP